MNGAATLKNGKARLERCEHQVVILYGSVGSRVLEGVISALESPLSLYSMLSSSDPIQMHRGYRI